MYHSYSIMYHCFQLRPFGDSSDAYTNIHDQCTVTALPHPPSNVTNVYVSNTPVHLSHDGRVNFTVQWSEPEILNGNATIGPTYQLWIGTEALPLNVTDVSSHLNGKLIFESEMQVSA